MSESPDPNWKFHMVELSSALNFLYEQNQSLKAARPNSYYAVETDLILEDARAATQALKTILTHVFSSQGDSQTETANPPDRRQVRTP